MHNDLTTSPVLKTLLRMTFPMSWGILSIIGFNIADTYFIGQLGKSELAAISLTFPVVLTFLSLALGTATATASIISRSLGRRDSKAVKRYTSDALTFALILVVVTVIIGIFTIEPIFILLGASTETLPLVKDYMSIWYWGMIFITVPMVGNGALRAQGDMVTASAIMIVAAITNIVLDPILIFGWGPIPAMGVKGAAIATVIARGTTFVASLSVLHFKYQMIDFKRPKFKIALTSWKKISFIAIPACGTNLIAPMAMSLITGLVARLGDASIAAYGVVNRIESLSLIFIIALASAIGPLVGQNFGAQKTQRIEKAMVSSFFMAFAWGTFMAFGLSIFASEFIPIFNNDEEVILNGVLYFGIVPITYGFYGIRLTVSSAFNALGKPYFSTMLAVINLLIFLVPLSYIGIQISGLKGVYYAQAISNILIGGISYYYYKKYLLLNEGLNDISK